MSQTLKDINKVVTNWSKKWHRPEGVPWNRIKFVSLQSDLWIWLLKTIARYQINSDETNEKYLTLNWNDKGGRLFVGGTIQEGETALECAKREIEEETGYFDIELLNESFPISHHYYAYNKNASYNVEMTGFLFKLISSNQNNL